MVGENCSGSALLSTSLSAHIHFPTARHLEAAEASERDKEALRDRVLEAEAEKEALRSELASAGSLEPSACYVSGGLSQSL